MSEDHLHGRTSGPSDPSGVPSAPAPAEPVWLRVDGRRSVDQR